MYELVNIYDNNCCDPIYNICIMLYIYIAICATTLSYASGRNKQNKLPCVLHHIIITIRSYYSYIYIYIYIYISRLCIYKVTYINDNRYTKKIQYIIIE